MLDPLIIKAISIGLGLMFILAGYHKLVVEEFTSHRSLK